MPKKSYIRILFLFGMALTLTIVSCVDTSVQPIPSTIDYRSEVKVVNFAQGVSSADFTMLNADGSKIQFGAIPFGNEDNASSFVDVPAGSKSLSFNSEEFKFSADVDKKIRIFVIGPSSERSVVKFTQRYIFQTKDDAAKNGLYRADTAAIAFFNGSVDAVISGIQAVSSTVDTTFEFSPSLEIGDAANYSYLKAGNFTMNVLSGDSTISVIQVNLEPQKRYTAAVYDTQASLKNKVFIDD